MVYLFYAGIPDYVVKPAAVVAALPFKDEKKSVAGKSTEEDRHEEHESSELEDDGVENPRVLRVATRANVPYNLEGYTKNAMLLMNTTAEYPRGYDNSIPAKMAAVTNAFANYRFEIEQHTDLTDDEIDEKCYEFFQRDFTDYGCVAVVLLKPDGCKISDSVIVQHWTVDGNPTLQGKPKLYINESSHQYAFRRGYTDPYYSVPITDDHPDVLCFHIPAIFHNEHVSQPLHIFCNKLTTMCDEHILSIIKETIQDSKSMFRTLTYVATTQTRKLFLARTPQVFES